jgi:hypothetical protein
MSSQPYKAVQILRRGELVPATHVSVTAAKPPSPAVPAAVPAAVPPAQPAAVPIVQSFAQVVQAPRPAPLTIQTSPSKNTLRPGGVFTPVMGFSPRPGFKMHDDDDEAPILQMQGHMQAQGHMQTQMQGHMQTQTQMQGHMQAQMQAQMQGHMQAQMQIPNFELPLPNQQSAANHQTPMSQSLAANDTFTPQLNRRIHYLAMLAELQGDPLLELDNLLRQCAERLNGALTPESLHDVRSQIQSGIGEIKLVQLKRSIAPVIAKLQRDADMLNTIIEYYNSSVPGRIDATMTVSTNSLRVQPTGRITPPNAQRTRFSGNGQTMVHALADLVDQLAKEMGIRMNAHITQQAQQQFRPVHRQVAQSPEEAWLQICQLPLTKQIEEYNKR